VKFFTKSLHKGIFAAFCHIPDLYRNRRDMPFKTQKRRQDNSSRQAFPAITVLEKRKTYVVRSSLQEYFS
jgi:hypothetical protein